MSDPQALSAAVERLLEPLVQLLIRNGVAHGAFSEIAKKVYVDVAAEEERIAGRKQTVSRMSILTGLTRKEVSRLLKLPTTSDAEPAARYNRAARVITGWIRDEQFQDEAGEPRPLRLDGEEPSFATLVKSYSGDVPPRAMLDELERVGAVRRSEDGVLTLEVRGYLPRSGEGQKLQILGSDVAGLISTIRHNLDAAPTEAFYQRKVFYDNLRRDCLPALRQLAAKHGQALLERLDAWMSEHDMDGDPQEAELGGKRAGIGVYYFEENDEPEAS